MALVTMSHSPLMGFTEPAVETRERVDMALGGARKFVAEFDPELVVLFGPDHYNGFFYDMMPSFCIGASAESIGDYDTPAGPLLVDHDVAWTFVRAALDAEIDVALSERMYVDHGVAQPLEVLLGGGRPNPGGAGLHQLRRRAHRAGTARAPPRIGYRVNGGEPQSARVDHWFGWPVTRSAGTEA